VLPGPAGDLRYRLYRPPGEGPHPLVAYFHGGGWVLGSHESDDPLCRDLCVRSDAVVVSVDYRHAPEARFPAAADDAFAAVRWIAANAIELGGIPGQLAVAGWSAGANVAAVACQQARDAGGPDIAAQLLLMPVTDADIDPALLLGERGGVRPHRLPDGVVLGPLRRPSRPVPTRGRRPFERPTCRASLRR
jgi:acetyl esterase/lipase